MRIAVTGAYGNGKTTLTTVLAPRLSLPRVHGRPMRDPLGSAPKALDDCSDLELFQLTLRRFAERISVEERNPRGFVSDGSVLHEWIYLVVRLAVGRHPGPRALVPTAATSPYAEVAHHLGAVVKQWTCDAYDLFVYLPADVSLAPDETAINERFRALSDRLLLDILHELGRPVHIVHGDIEERAEKVIGLVSGN
jgi:hypothetical protein